MYGLNHLNSTNHLSALFTTSAPYPIQLHRLNPPLDLMLLCNPIRVTIGDHHNTCKWKISQKRTRSPKKEQEAPRFMWFCDVYLVGIQSQLYVLLARSSDCDRILETQGCFLGAVHLSTSYSYAFIKILSC